MKIIILSLYVTLCCGVELVAQSSFERKESSIDLNVYDFNIVAISCYEKLGFLKTQEIQLTEFKGEIWKSIRMNLNIQQFKF